VDVDELAFAPILVNVAKILITELLFFFLCVDVNRDPNAKVKFVSSECLAEGQSIDVQR